VRLWVFLSATCRGRWSGTNEFSNSEPDLAPVDGVVEFHVGPLRLQLGEDSTVRSGAEVVTRFGVADARWERERLEAMGVTVGSLEHVPGAVDHFDFTDPDGNVLSMYSEVEQ
jgi:hypothetical protein